ncbi:hypothetical protein DL240_01680 [Lujinxingia litoralis]|uniref:Adhesin domain-containing protein n=1 Tax=Lujinxingia litoralis TaxID=2211119 RepID=A0A328CB68_9DELT|nr:hypothetical protein DL240_01680 [Lujinxingia litoralis]
MWGLVCAGVVIGLGCSEELEEVDRRVFESAVSEVQVKVERDEVHVFGSDQSKGLVLDRWSSPREEFARLEEHQSGDRVEVVASCASAGGCRARYDLSLPEQSRVAVEMEEGHLGLYHLAGEVRARVGRGQVVGKHLSADHIELDLGEGTVDVIVANRPSLLVVRLQKGTARLVMPPGRYRCEFDRFDAAIDLDEFDCHGMMDQGVRLELGPGARVTFRVNRDYEGPTP